MRVVAGVTEEGEYWGVEGNRAFLGDLDLREGELTRCHTRVRSCISELKKPKGEKISRRGITSPLRIAKTRAITSPGIAHTRTRNTV